MKIKTTKVIELTAKETGDILCHHLSDKLNADGALGATKSGKADDLEGLAAEVTLVFESDGASA